MALILQNNPAPNGPGAPPTWSRGDKDGVGTAYSASSQVWYTVAGGVITEVYYPDVDTPQIRDLQLLVTDGKTESDLSLFSLDRPILHEANPPRTYMV